MNPYITTFKELRLQLMCVGSFLIFKGAVASGRGFRGLGFGVLGLGFRVRVFGFRV